MFSKFFAPSMITDSRQKRFVMYMQFRQCFVRAKLFQLKKLTEKEWKRKIQILIGFFWISKKANAVKKAEFQNRLQKCQVGNPARDHHCMRLLLLGNR